MSPELAAVLVTAFVAIAGGWVAVGGPRMIHLENRIDRLEAARAADALVKRAQGDHIDVLERHIWDGKPPPPPTRPEGV